MRWGVFSDVHGNLEALQACLKRLQKEQVDGYLFCGDIIGYGPDAQACVQQIASLPNATCVMGNHDAVFLLPELESCFNPEALQALQYSKKILSESSLRYLNALPPVCTGKGFTLVHGTPLDPIKEYFSSCMQFRANFNVWKGQVCFVGHAHLPFYIQGNSRTCSVHVNKESDFTVQLVAELRYVVNPGSCGKPRDNDSRAAFGLWDTQENLFRFLRQEYDVKKTQKKMQRAGLPAFLIDSLALGL